MADNVFQFKKKESTTETVVSAPPEWKSKISQFYGIYKPGQILSLVKHPCFQSLVVTKGVLLGAEATRFGLYQTTSVTNLPHSGESAFYEFLFVMEEFSIGLQYRSQDGWFKSEEHFSFMDHHREGIGFHSQGVKIFSCGDMTPGQNPLVHEHEWQSTAVETLTQIDLADPNNRHPLAVYYRTRADFTKSFHNDCLLKKETLTLNKPDKSFAVFAF